METNEKARRHPGLSLDKFRIWIVIVGGIILICAMVLSYSHTVELFNYAGYFWVLAHIGTIMIELTFFLGTSVIILSRSVGMKAGWPARATFIFGAGLVLWSNVSSGIMLLDEQWTAVVLGVAVVTCLFLMEAVVSRALFTFRDDVQAEAIEQEPAVFEQEPEAIEQEPEVFEQEPEAIEQEPEVFEQEPEVFERELEVFERKPWMKPLFEQIKQEIEQEKELPTIRALAEKGKVTPYKAGEALKMWKETAV